MARHTSPNRQRIDDGFPVRVKIRVPPNGLGKRLDDIHQWLKDNLPSDRSAMQSTRGVYMDATAIYFRGIEDAALFLDSFPDLDLADGIAAAERVKHREA